MDFVRKVLLIYTVCIPLSVCGHMCLLQQRRDTVLGKERWSLPSKERCHCQRVLKIKPGNGPKLCRSEDEDDEDEPDMWFTDDADSLTRRENWTKDILNELLDREILCDYKNPVVHDTPSNITLTTDSGAPTAVVIWSEPTATDNSGYQTLTSSHTSGDSYPIGVTLVSYTSVDRSGNTDTQVFYIHITDVEKPVIVAMPADKTLYIDNRETGDVVTWIEPTATDNSGSQSLLSSHSSGELFPIGVTVVNYTSTDPSGNIDLQTFTVTINGVPPAEDCYDIMHSYFKTTTGSYIIYPDLTQAEGGIDVWCDMDTDGGGWTVFQRRQDGSVDFYRNWTQYEAGFGDIEGEFWLGNQHLHTISTVSGKSYNLRIDLDDGTESRFAVYDNFYITGSEDKYRFKLGTYLPTSNAGDAMVTHRDRKFSTFDRDNDGDGSRNCAVAFKGAWWYNDCHAANLNGLYLFNQVSPYGEGLSWYPWRGHRFSMKKTEMKLRRM